MFTPPYQRRSLFARWGIELMLSRWHPHAASATHDHGGGRGLVFVLWGTALERRGHPQGELAQRECRRGSVLRFSPACEHQMIAGPDGAGMLHVYWGVHRGMRMRTAAGERVEVPPDHGAWWPEPD